MKKAFFGLLLVASLFATAALGAGAEYKPT